MSDSRKFLIAIDSDEQSIRMKQLLESEFPDSDVDTARSYVEANDRLNTWQKAMIPHECNLWLIVSERLGYKTPASNEPDTTAHVSADGGEDAVGEGYGSGYRLAYPWAEIQRGAKPTRRAILLADSDWEGSKISFTDRVLGLQSIGWYERKDELIEIVRAAEHDVTIFPTTVIRYRLDIERLDVEDAQCVLRYCNVDSGPLTKFVETELHKSEVNREFRFPCLDKEYADVQQATNAKSRRSRILELAHDLHSELEKCGFLRVIRRLIQRVDDKWASRGFRPHAIQLHIMCDAGSLRNPIDIAMGINRPLTNSLGALLPVVWRLEVDDHDGTQTNRLAANSIDYSEECFAVGYADTHTKKLDYGGLEYRRIKSVHRHSEEILRIVDAGRPPKTLLATADVACLFQEVSGAESSQAIHLTAHGVHSDDADYTGLLVCSTVGSQVVTASDLADNKSPSVRFAFFNCCLLGHHNSAEKAQTNQHACFAEAVIVKRVCRETICNRWAVTQQHAKQLATEFYTWKPRTVYGRAIALLLARQNLLKQEHVVSFFAPVHVWEQL